MKKPESSLKTIVPLVAILFTNSDMYILSHKLGDSLRLKCKQLQTDSDVNVDFENATDNFINNGQFLELIQSEITGKTKLAPSTTDPSFELETRLLLEKKSGRYMKQYTYILAAKMLQADESLCKIKVKITKSDEMK